MIGISALLGYYASVISTVPTFGTVVIDSADLSAGSLTRNFANTITLSEGQGVLIAASVRQNGNPGAAITGFNLIPGAGDPIALTLGPTAYLGGAGRQLAGIAAARGITAGTYTPQVVFDDSAWRDFVGFAVPVDGMPASGNFIGAAPAGITLNTSDTAITGAITPQNANSLLAGLGAFGSGLLTLTANNATLLAQEPSGGGGTTVDIVAGLISRASGAGEITLGVNASATDDDRALVLLELLPS